MSNNAPDYEDNLAFDPNADRWYSEPLLEENTRLKENIHSMLFTDGVVQDRYDKAKRENEELKLLVAEAWAYFKASLPCLYRHWIEKADKFLGEE